MRIEFLIFNRWFKEKVSSICKSGCQMSCFIPGYPVRWLCVWLKILE